MHATGQYNALWSAALYKQACDNVVSLFPTARIAGYQDLIDFKSRV